MLPCSMQGKGSDEFPMFCCARAPVTCFLLPCRTRGQDNESFLRPITSNMLDAAPVASKRMTVTQEKPSSPPFHGTNGRRPKKKVGTAPRNGFYGMYTLGYFFGCMAEVVGWGCWSVVPTARFFVLFFLPRSFSRPVVASSRPSLRLFFSGVVLSSRSLCLHSLPIVTVDDASWSA